MCTYVVSDMVKKEEMNEKKELKVPGFYSILRGR